MLTALSAIASAQAKPTEDTMTCCKQFLDYVATHQDAIITYKKSDIELVVHSDASYLSEHKARSQAGRNFFISSNIDVFTILILVYQFVCKMTAKKHLKSEKRGPP
jgi:hypothetical protein